MPPSQAPKALHDGASIAVFKDGAVLLVLRGQAPYAGRWSLPGGKIEAGESAAAAALRELREETGIVAEIAGMLESAEIRPPEPGGAVYRLAVFYGHHIGGSLAPGDDSQDAQFVSLDALGTLLITEGTAALIRRAAERLRIC